MKQNLHRLTLKYYWQKALKYKWLLAIFFLASTIAVLGQEFVTTLIYKQIFDLMGANLNNTAAVYPELIRLVVLIGINHMATTFIGWRVANLTNDYFQPLVMRDIEEECFDKLQNHSHKFFTNHFTGGLVSKTNRFVRSFEMIADVVQWKLYKIIIMFIAAFSLTYYFLPIIAYSFLAWTIVYIVLSHLYAKWSIKFWRHNAKADSRVTAELADSLTNIFNVKFFAAKSYETTRFGQAINDRRRKRTAAWLTGGTLMGAWQGLMMIGFEVLLVWIMIDAWAAGQITLGTIFAIQTFVWIMFSNLWELGRLFQDYSNALADAEEMMGMLNQTPDILDANKPEPCHIRKGAIEFKNVGFKYETEKKTPHVFKDFNLQIKAGQKIGLVGESGAGKSTFVNLLIRFMDLNNGEIAIDEQNIRSITQDDLRRNIAYVPQDPILFHRTLAENITYGRPKATQTEIEAAAKAAHAHEFIQTFPEGYQTLVGERGVKLSGGQKQRVAIARAMLKQAPILILDEATSSLDSKAEQHIQAALEELMKGRTTLVIAHRLSTLRQMDRIVVFESGQITEDGTHDELVAKNGKYAELWQHQSGGFIS